jgi:hypothetical protein
MNEWKANIRIADIVVAVLTLILCTVAWLVTTTWIPPILPGDPGAAFFPRIAIGIMSVFAVLLLIQHVAKGKRRTGKEADAQTVQAKHVSIDLVQFCVALFFSGAVVAGMHFIGFEAATFAFLFILLGWRTRRWFWVLITALISTGLMYLVFVTVLKVRLPLVFLPKYLTIQDIINFLNPF